MWLTSRILAWILVGPCNAVLLQVENEYMVAFMFIIALSAMLMVLLNALGAILINSIWEAIKHCQFN